jgi:hypothetical protein
LALGILIVTILVMAGCDDDGDRRSAPTPTSGGANPTTVPTREFPTSSAEAAATPTGAPADIEIRDAPEGFLGPELAAVQSECTEQREALAVLSWRPSQPVGLQQQVHVLLGQADFAAGDYLSSQDLQPQVSTLSWDGLTPSTTYYWRVATRVDGGWVAAEPERFSTQPCQPIDPIG